MFITNWSAADNQFSSVMDGGAGLVSIHYMQAGTVNFNTK